MQHWIFLVLAITLDVAGVISMKLSDGFTKTVPSIMLFVFYAATIFFLTLALKRIDVSVAYTIWSGVGTALIAVIGILYFREAMTGLRLFSLLFIVVGMVGLNISYIKQ